MRETHCFELIQSYVKAGERVCHSRSSDHNWWSTQVWAIVPIARAFTTKQRWCVSSEKLRRSGQSKAKPGVKTIWSAVWGTRGKTPRESLPSLLVTWLQGWPLARWTIYAKLLIFDTHAFENVLPTIWSTVFFIYLENTPNQVSALGISFRFS